MAADTTQVVQTKGIYHGLPTFPDSVEGLTAIITGANGMSGQYMLQVLAESPKRWRKIYCLSRRPPAVKERLPAHAEHIPCDFMKSPQEIGGVLKEKGVTADYVFFFAYIQPPPAEGKPIWSNADELTQVNKAILDNFLGALPIANIKPKRFLLQTGAKNYGIHTGPTKTPMEETDPRTDKHEPNFYFAQEDSLWQYCAAQHTSWTIVMPSVIVGAVPDAAMNAVLPLAIYASVCAHLGEPLVFPGDINAWQMHWEISSSKLNAYLSEWATISDAGKDQKLNVCDDSAFAWEGTWPRVAGWYGAKWEGPNDDEKEKQAKYIEVNTPYDPPPRGYGGPGTARFKFSMAQWAKQPKVAQAWAEIAKKNNLVSGELQDIDRVFSFLDGWLVFMPPPLHYNMAKARKLGWHGMVDSNESILESMECLASLRLTPPVPHPRSAS